MKRATKSAQRDELGSREKQSGRAYRLVAVPSRRSGYVPLRKSVTRASDKSSAHSEAERPSIRSEAWLGPVAYDNVYYQRRTPVVRGAPIVHKSDREIRGIETKHLDVLHDIAHTIIRVAQ